MHWDKRKFENLATQAMQQYKEFARVESNDLPQWNLLFRRKKSDNKFDFLLFQPHTYDPSFTVECAISGTEDFPINAWPLGITASINQNGIRARIGYLAKQKHDLWFYLIGWPSEIKKDSSEWIALHFQGLLFTEPRYEQAINEAFEMIQQFAIPFFEDHS